jgi:methylated-DNA-[protein]-cysteine S-methyltransferase
MSKVSLQFLIDRIETPIGEMIVVADPQGRLRAVDWTDHEDRMLRLLHRHYGSLGFDLTPSINPSGLVEQIQRYFAGDLSALNKLHVETEGTPFQREVWQALREISCGTSITYAELARRIGKPNAVRAVGLANGANPVGVVVPCHRVIAASGALTGYAGGVERKRWLLQHELGNRLF